MKTRIIFYLLLAFFIAACSKDENPDPVKNNEPPRAFNLIEIADRATDVSVMPAFSWQSATDPDGDAVTYRIYLNTETDPATELAAGLSQTSYTTTDRLHLSTPYHWKVVAEDDKNNQTESTATFTFTTRNISKGEEATPDADFSARALHSSVVFNNKIWVIGGLDGDFNFKNDVWYSNDGTNWTRTIPDPGAIFSGRYGHSSVVFDNKIWVLGGHDATGLLKNDVWYSTDGVNWGEAKTNAHFSERFGHSSVVHDGKIWVLGGSDGTFKNDVWYSSDGFIWTASPDAGFPARRYHTSVVYDNKIWVIGGNGDTSKNDIWYSSDGTNWTRATPEAGADFSARTGHSSMVYDDKIWIIGGYAGTNYKNDIWYSSDGTTWEEAAPNANFSGRFGHSSEVYDDKIWVMGGRSYNLNYFNNVWYMD